MSAAATDLPSRQLRAAGTIALTSVLVLAGCAQDVSAPAPDNEHVFELSGPDQARVASNRDGSVWRGPASLVPLGTIGVDDGPAELMFGRVADFAVTDDHVYVLETRPAVVRKYTHDGAWVADVGGAGQGPGEFEWPSGLAVDEAAGRLYVKHRDPEALVSLALDGGTPGSMPLASRTAGRSRMRPTPRGLARVSATRRGDNPFDESYAIEWLSPSGEVLRSAALPDHPRALWTMQCDGGGAVAVPVPFAPTLAWALAPDGGFVTGYAERYEFTIHEPDGATVTVRRYWTPIAVGPSEHSWRVERAGQGAGCGDQDPVWDGPEAPGQKAAYSRLLVDPEHRIWVVREGTGAESDCSAPDEPEGTVLCWRSERLVDLFDADGRYLGPLDLPDEVELRIPPAMSAGRILLLTTDAWGTERLTWYELVEPGS